MGYSLLKGLSMVNDDELSADEIEKNELQKIVYNSKLNEGYLTLARDIEVMEPKSPEDIYKVFCYSPIQFCSAVFVCVGTPANIIF